ncbi:sugar phosphate isomerase/epimerase family protein [Thiohalobacter sp.]|uniref:sugar phosphate isomerase/epimerase family protein n=1 Tax=Thiohalobacter sp. TaxID=2025948 RepID=UPI0026368094|nr:TIM barrel protein [Thiohalobacter sp.]
MTEATRQMKLSISNIAWSPANDSEVALLLNREDVHAIDIAPGKYFTDFPNVNLEEVSRVKTWWNARGIEIVGMQSLLFGVSGLNVFGDMQTRRRLRQHMKGVFRISSELGALRLTFGSPKNRDRSGLSDDAALDIAAEAFLGMAEDARSYGVTLCLEPNPVLYGCNFLTNTREVAEFVRLLDHPALRLQLDIGAMCMNNESPSLIEEVIDLVGHIHISEPHLRVLSSRSSFHQAVFSVLEYLGWGDFVTIEMLSSESATELSDVSNALLAAKAYLAQEV